MAETSFAALALRLVLSLGVVLALMLGAAAVLKRKSGGRLGGRTGTMEVLARQPLGRSAQLAVVRVGDRHLVVGVTEHSVTLIDEADGALFAPVQPVSEEELEGAQWTALPGGGHDGRPVPAWMALMDSLRDKTLRRS